MPRLLERAWNYLDAPQPSDSLCRLQGVKVFLNEPIKGINYTCGEMRWGIVVQVLLTLYMAYLLIVKGPLYSALNLVISWWLLLSNLFQMVCKIILYYHFSNLDTSEPIENLKRKMRIIFTKRVYNLNVVFTGLCLMNYIICLPLAMLLWKYEERVPDLFLYSLIFVLRYFYSMFRYSQYFIHSRDPKNPYGFPCFVFGDLEAAETYPKVRERDSCSICLSKFESADKVVEFPCENHHYFHLECMFKWISVSLACPLCKTNVFKEE